MGSHIPLPGHTLSDLDTRFLLVLLGFHCLLGMPLWRTRLYRLDLWGTRAKTCMGRHPLKPSYRSSGWVWQRSQRGEKSWGGGRSAWNPRLELSSLGSIWTLVWKFSYQHHPYLDKLQHNSCGSPWLLRLKCSHLGWRGGPGIKTTCCSCRGAWLGSQHRHGSSQFPFQGSQSPNLHGLCILVVPRHICRQKNTHMQNKNKYIWKTVQPFETHTNTWIHD